MVFDTLPTVVERWRKKAKITTILTVSRRKSEVLKVADAKSLAE